MLRVLGYPVQLTRDTDRSLHDPSASTIREKKVSDMKNRLALYNASRLTVSIHANQFTQPQYSGAQVFYGTGSPESRGLAQSIRTSVLSLLQPDNTRELKVGGKDIYLLYHATSPAVLVECGFLSNAQELQQLKTPAYQQIMALAIACGIMAYRPL